jgi:hypothetical protein
MDVGRQAPALGPGQVEVVERQDAGAQAIRGQQGRQLRRQRRLAGTLRPGQADD